MSFAECKILNPFLFIYVLNLFTRKDFSGKFAIEKSLRIKCTVFVGKQLAYPVSLTNSVKIVSSSEVAILLFSFFSCTILFNLLALKT